MTPDLEDFISAPYLIFWGGGHMSYWFEWFQTPETQIQETH